MAVFSITKRDQKAATEHTEAQAEKQKEEPRTKYRHVPTHAASDALLGAPSGWNREDASKIREHNRRRSAIQTASQGSRPATGNSMLSPMHGTMAHSYSSGNLGGASTPNYASSSSSKGPGQWSQSNSGLSKVSFPAGPSNPVVHMSQNYKSMNAELRSDDSFMTAVASGSGSAHRVSGSGKQADYGSKTPPQHVSSLMTPTLSVPMSPGGEGSKDSVLYDMDILEMKTFTSSPSDGSGITVPSDGTPSITPTGQQEQSSLPCSHSPAPRSRFSRLFRSNSAAVAV